MIPTRKRLTALFLALALVFAGAMTAGPASALTDEEIIRTADLARGGGIPGIEWEVTAETVYADGDTESRTLVITAKQTDWAAEFVAPNKIRGQRLVKRGNNMWFSKPDLRKPVPISQRQRLTGNASNGDIASTNYLRDYEITRLDDETLDGTETYVFRLEAKDSTVTYDKIKYWVSKETGLGIAAEFYSKAERLLKSARFEYDNTLVFEGEERPFISEMIIRDAINTEDVTTLSYADARVRDVPDSILMP